MRVLMRIIVWFQWILIQRRQGKFRQLHKKSTTITATISPPQNTVISNDNTNDGVETVTPEEQIEAINEINNELSCKGEAPLIGGSIIKDIINHKWGLGRLILKIQWSSEDTSWEGIRDMRQDNPRMTMRYILDNKVQRYRLVYSSLSSIHTHIGNVLLCKRFLKERDLWLDRSKWRIMLVPMIVSILIILRPIFNS